MNKGILQNHSVGTTSYSNYATFATIELSKYSFDGAPSIVPRITNVNIRSRRKSYAVIIEWVVNPAIL